MVLLFQSFWELVVVPSSVESHPRPLTPDGEEFRTTLSAGAQLAAHFD
jgi:hypothetical protein